MLDWMIGKRRRQRCGMIDGAEAVDEPLTLSDSRRSLSRRVDSDARSDRGGGILFSRFVWMGRRSANEIHSTRTPAKFFFELHLHRRG